MEFNHIETRTYQGLTDLQPMLDLLAEGRRADNGTYYVHRGDLQWWLFYNDDLARRWESMVRLWLEEGRLIGWCLLSPFDGHAFDVYTAPHLRGTSIERDMLAWAVENMPAQDYIHTVWVAEDDEVRVRWLEENGFLRREVHMLLLKRPLSGTLESPALPEGFSVRASRGQVDARARALASKGAFGSSVPMDEYHQRTLRFVQSPVYVNDHEWFVVAPDGAVAAFCCIWTDTLNKAGYFEPVGVHPDYQRRGLGKCLLQAGLRQLQSEGMTEASVCAESDNPAAIHLYEAAGFRRTRRLLTYRKEKSRRADLPAGTPKQAGMEGEA